MASLNDACYIGPIVDSIVSFAHLKLIWLFLLRSKQKKINEIKMEKIFN